MSSHQTAAVERPSRAVRFFASHEEQEAETSRYWASRTIDQRLAALSEILRHPVTVTLADGEADNQADSGRIARLFKNREEQEAWNEQRRSTWKKTIEI